VPVALIVGLTLGLSVPAMLLVGYCFPYVVPAASGPNARCPHCLTPCRISGLERMTFHQKAAVRHRCPTCGNVDEVIFFEQMAGGGQPPPPENRPENVIVPDR
jgi:hypothetical protein